MRRFAHLRPSDCWEGRAPASEGPQPLQSMSVLLAEPHLLGPSQASCPALAGRTADSSPRCHRSTDSSTLGRRTPWRSWGPGGLSLEQKELDKEKGEEQTQVRRLT